MPDSPPPILLRYPLDGAFRVENSPADRVPSHGTWLWGTGYAIDLVPVDDRGRSRSRTWRTLLVPERPESFAGFGRRVVAPCDGVVAAVHDGEADHVAHRSPWSRLAYALGQPGRVRAGAAAIAGNHVIIRLPEPDAFVLIAHLRRSSIRVQRGDHVREGQEIGACGNSGNSTEPHVHVQVTAGLPSPHVDALPLAFRDGGTPRVPRSGEIVRT